MHRVLWILWVIAYCVGMALAEVAEPWVPRDTFAARLALVRQWLGGWNVKRAATLCEIDDQSWRNWEAGASRPRDYETICARIADRTGCDLRWLMAGGPLTRWSSDTPSLTSVDTRVEDPFQLRLTFERPALALLNAP